MINNTLVDAYNSVYELEAIRFYDFKKRFPQNRNEALVWLANSGNKVLEIGCGGGNVLYNLRHNFLELYGLEMSSQRSYVIQQSAIENNLNLNIITGNIEQKLEFEDGFFDTIIWADVIEHVVDIWAAMKEISRLLAPGGTLITCTPNIAELRRRLTLLCGRFPSTSGKNQGLDVRENELFDGGHLHYFTFSSLANLYRMYDVKPEKFLGFGNLGCFHNIYPPLLSSAVCIIGIKQN
jgi:SAM-dependent methyltransferase